MEYLSLYVEEDIYLPGDFIISRGELNDHVIYLVSGQVSINMFTCPEHLTDCNTLNEMQPLICKVGDLIGNLI